MKIQDLLLERITSKHVLNRSDLIAIMNMVEKEFGPPDVDTRFGTCLIAQIAATLSAVTEATSNDLDRYFQKGQGIVNFNSLESIVKFVNETPMKIGRKKFQSKISIGKVTTASKIKDQLRKGQPVIGAYRVNDLLGSVLDMIDHAEKSEENFFNRLLYQITDTYDFHGINIIVSKDESRKIRKDFQGGFVTKMVYDIFKNYSGRDQRSTFHSVICFGHDGGDGAFLFRESRDLYAMNGYLKIDEKLFTPQNLRVGSGFIEGMFYVQLDEFEEVDNVN